MSSIGDSVRAQVAAIRGELASLPREVDATIEELVASPALAAERARVHFSRQLLTMRLAAAERTLAGVEGAEAFFSVGRREDPPPPPPAPARPRNPHFSEFLQRPKPKRGG